MTRSHALLYTCTCLSTFLYYYTVTVFGLRLSFVPSSPLLETKKHFYITSPYLYRLYLLGMVLALLRFLYDNDEFCILCMRLRSIYSYYYVYYALFRHIFIVRSVSRLSIILSRVLRNSFSLRYVLISWLCISTIVYPMVYRSWFSLVSLCRFGHKIFHVSSRMHAIPFLFISDVLLNLYYFHDV